jgi:hypothetical protein
VAALIKTRTGADAELIEGGRGEFTVWVDDERVAQKTSGTFPSDDEAVEAVRRALGERRPG